MASPPAAVLNVDAELMNSLSGLDDAAFDRTLRHALENVFNVPTDGDNVAVPLTVSSTSLLSVSDGSAVADVVVVDSSTDANGQPARVVERHSIHSDIGPSASEAGSRFSQEPESIEDIDLALAEAEVRVLKAKRNVALKSKPSSNASLSSLRIDRKRSKQTGASSSASGVVHEAASSSNRPEGTVIVGAGSASAGVTVASGQAVASIVPQFAHLPPIIEPISDGPADANLAARLAWEQAVRARVADSEVASRAVSVGVG